MSNGKTAVIFCLSLSCSREHITFSPSSSGMAQPVKPPILHLSPQHSCHECFHVWSASRHEPSPAPSYSSPLSTPCLADTLTNIATYQKINPASFSINQSTRHTHIDCALSSVSWKGNAAQQQADCTASAVAQRGSRTTSRNFTLRWVSSRLPVSRLSTFKQGHSRGITGHTTDRNTSIPLTLDR